MEIAWRSRAGGRMGERGREEGVRNGWREEWEGAEVRARDEVGDGIVGDKSGITPISFIYIDYRHRSCRPCSSLEITWRSPGDRPEMRTTRTRGMQHAAAATEATEGSLRQMGVVGLLASPRFLALV